MENELATAQREKYEICIHTTSPSLWNSFQCHLLDGLPQKLEMTLERKDFLKERQTGGLPGEDHAVL